MTLIQSSTEDTTPDLTDIIGMGVKDPAGTPLDRHYTWLTATRLGGGRLSASTPNTNITGAVGKTDVITMSSMTADRDYVLPTTAAFGDVCGIMIVDGDPDYEILIKSGAAGDLINGIDHSTNEWSRLFIAGERLQFVCIDAAGPHWLVQVDGRIPCYAMIKTSTAQTTNGTNSWNLIEYDTLVGTGVGNIHDTTNYRITPRRNGTFHFRAGAYPNSTIIDGNNYGVGLWVDGSTIQGFTRHGNGKGDNMALEIATYTQMSVGEYMEAQYYSESSNRGVSGSQSQVHLVGSEQLP